MKIRIFATAVVLILAAGTLWLNIRVKARQVGNMVMTYPDDNRHSSLIRTERRSGHEKETTALHPRV